MKKIISALSGSILVALISFNQVTAQEVASSDNKLSHTNNLPGFKIAASTSTSSVTVSVNKKALKNFAKTYPGKVRPEWGLLESGGYTASFIEADMQNCVYYDKGGNWTGDIKRYDESKMSRELRQIIKPVYYDYKINGIAEITVPGNVIHLVYLSANASNFKTIRVCNDEMEVIEWIKDNKIMDL